MKRNPGSIWATFICVALIASMLVIPSRPVCRADALDEKWKELEKLEKEIETYKAQLGSKKRTEASVTAELQRLERELNLAEKELAYIRARISYFDEQIERTREDIAAIEARLDRQKSAFEARLTSMYKASTVSYFEVLLSSGSLSEFLARLHYLKEIAQQDSQLIDEYTTGKNELLTKKASLEQGLAELSHAKQTQEQKRREVTSRSMDRERYLTQLQQDREKLEQALDEMDRQSKALEKEIRDLQAKTGRVKKDKLSMIWPVTGGWISDVYGWRWHPVLGGNKFHAGLDYAANSGTPIRAAEDGTVIVAGENGGYGNCVILDHGGGISTLYAHCKSLAVKKGQEVFRGDVIGHVGSTGISNGPHLHFEVRVNGSTDDPLKWLP